MTLYNSINTGSFLQAYSLKKYLERQGYEVFFFKNKARKPFLDLFFVIMKNIIIFRFKKAKFVYQKYKAFKKCLKEFKITTKIKEDDVVIYGSDEIWNIKRDNIKKYKYFFGCPTYKSLSFSPSINRSTKEDFFNYPKIIDSLKSINFISVRDFHSKRELESLLSREIQVTTDPTMLIDLRKEKGRKDGEKNLKDKFILLYSYPNNFKDRQIKALIKFAEDNDLKIISCNHLFSWCHQSIAASPFEVLDLFEKAEYVVTDTFHGTVFSLIFQKKFVTYASDNVKIYELVEQFGCESAIIDVNTDFKKLITNKLNYELISRNIEEYSKTSKKYLRESIGVLVNEKNLN